MKTKANTILRTSTSKAKLVAAALTWGIAVAALLAAPAVEVVASPQLEPVAAYAVASPGASARGVYLVAASMGESGTPGRPGAAGGPYQGLVLYVAGIQDKALWKVDLSTGKILARADLAALNPDAWGKAVAVDARGMVWAPGTVPELYVFDPELKPVAQYDLRPFGLVDPEGITFDQDGRVYVTDRKGLVGIYRFLLTAPGELVLDETWGESGYLALGSDLRQPASSSRAGIVVGDFGSTKVYTICPCSGRPVPLADLPARPFHVAVDEAGRVYVVHYDGEPALTILSPGGEILATYTRSELGLRTEASGVAVVTARATAAGAGTSEVILVVLDQRPADGVNVRVFRLKL